MSFTTVAFYQSQDSAALVNVNGVPDAHVRVSGADIIVPADLPNIGGFFAGGPNITGGRFVSPVLRKSLNLDVSPLDAAIIGPTAEGIIHDYWDHPIKLAGRDILNFMASEGGAGATACQAVVFLMDQLDPVPDGVLSTLQLTGSTTLVANQWTSVTLTPAQNLAPGNYGIVGMRAASTNCRAARLVIPGSYWRPGCPGVAAITSALGFGRYRHGYTGLWGMFAHDQPPTAEFLSNVADTAETVWLDVVGPLA